MLISSQLIVGWATILYNLDLQPNLLHLNYTSEKYSFTVTFAEGSLLVNHKNLALVSNKDIKFASK
jgi:hypothetical protein